MDLDHWISRYRIFALAFYAIGLFVVASGLLRFESNLEDVFQWLPDETPDRELYNDFIERFGVDDFLVVTWPGCTIADQTCETLAEQLIERDDRNFIAQAISGRRLIRELIKQARQSPKAVIERFKGIYFGPDGRQTCVMVLLTRRGMDHRVASVAYVKDTAKSVGISSDDLVLAGYPQIGAYGDAIVKRSLQDFVGPSCLISTLVAWICLRNIRLTVMILAVSGLAAGLSISAVTLSGAKWGGLSSVIPALAYVLSVSGSLHLVNYSRTPSNERLFLRVLRIGWKPCLLSSLTTAVGMLSLCRSEFPAVRDFGIYCACGVLASLMCQLLLVPCAIDWLNPKNLQTIDQNTRSRFLDWLLPRCGLVVLTFVGVTVVCGLGLEYLRSDLEVERYFSRNAPVMQDIDWLEKNVGPVEQTELLIQFNDISSDGFGSRLQSIRQLEEELRAYPNVAAVLSVSAWLPPQPQGSSLRMTARRSAYRKLINESRDELSSTPYLDIGGDWELWRISIRFPFLQPTNFKEIKNSLPELAAAVLAAGSLDANVSVRHTGVSLLYHVAQDELVADLYRNFTFAFVMICPLMMLVLQSVKRGAVAMIPNVCPAVVAYGLLGWLDYPLDIGMAMTACVALGIAVDDTTHFMLRFQDLTREPGINPAAALRIAFHQCSRAMFCTTLITGMGLSAFLFGTLATMTRFASLLIVLIIIALLCDLVLLPSLMKTFRFSSSDDEET